MATPRLEEALRSNDVNSVARAVRFLNHMTAEDAHCLGEWIKRNARRWQFSRQRRPRMEDTYTPVPGVERPKFEELDSALVRNHPEDIAKHLTAGLPRPWIGAVADWIERYFGPPQRGRPKRDSMTQTLEDVWLALHSESMATIRDAARSLGWTEPDQAQKASTRRERGRYSGAAPRTIKRARSRLRTKKK